MHSSILGYSGVLAGLIHCFVTDEGYDLRSFTPVEQAKHDVRHLSI